MSDASTLAELPFAVGENTDPLPIPPRTAAPDVPTNPIHEVLIRPTFYRVSDGDFPHPDEPVSEPNDSDQENIPPPVQEVPRSRPAIHTPLGRSQAAVPITDDPATNQAILAAITRVHNTVHRGDTYVSQIEEIVRIARALRHRGTPSEDDEAAALVAQLHQI